MMNFVFTKLSLAMDSSFLSCRTLEYANHANLSSPKRDWKPESTPSATITLCNWAVCTLGWTRIRQSIDNPLGAATGRTGIAEGV